MWQQMFLNQWSVRIGGGTEQIQKNVLGERVLGLPGEPRPDKTAPLPRPPPQLARPTSRVRARIQVVTRLTRTNAERV